MRKIIEYHIVTASDIDELEKQVNYYIQDDFEPFGNVFCNDVLLFQTIVKYD